MKKPLSGKIPHFRDISIGTKLLFATLFMALSILFSNIIIYRQVNSLLTRLNQVYSSNVDLTELSDSLDEVQEYLYRYLEVRDYDSLSSYYRAAGEYRELFEEFPTQVSNNPIRVREKNIRSMSEKFLSIADDAVTAKRGMNIERYKDLYQDAMRLYNFIGDDLSVLNEQQFENNSASYLTLQRAVRYMEVTSLIVLAVVILISLMVMIRVTQDLVQPLQDLAQTARLVGEGDFARKAEEVDSQDEIGVVTRAFNRMIDSLGSYIVRIRESAEKEQEMKERELMMQNHLKEAQLKFLQAQINPHFLFNSLNAGVQLAEMEDDEKTAVFLSRMADFFRYNVKKGAEDATVREELETVENYIYILNVRFAGEIDFAAQTDEEALDFRMPSMILQPLVENAVTHGIRSMDSGGQIRLTIRSLPEEIRIDVTDNGAGMSREQIEALLEAGRTVHEEDSTGIGLDNVISRLSIYYETENPVEIRSDGPGKGTEVTLHLPKKTQAEGITESTESGEEQDVSDSDCG